MNKTDFINAVAQKTGSTKKQTDIEIAAMFEVIQDILVAGDKLQIPGFGTFCVNERAAREGRNPRTGEVIKIAAAKVPAFKPSKVLKAAVNA